MLFLWVCGLSGQEQEECEEFEMQQGELWEVSFFVSVLQW